MNYSNAYWFLRERFNLDQGEIHVPELNISINKYTFQSSYDFPHPESPSLNIAGLPNHEFNDHTIKENCSFTYPIFTPSEVNKFNAAIIMLHGLNERNWNKYLAWAQYLANNTKKPVILFPMSFHVNRSPCSWTDPKQINEHLTLRKVMYRDVQESTYLNLALSNRLTDYPERVFLSGYQSINDMVSLIRNIRSGFHPLFNKDAKVDFFAYSISVFLIQCMMIANPDNLLDNSRFFFLAGGALFSQMNGVSKYIMDSKAHERLQYYYVHQMENEIKKERNVTSILNITDIGKAFRSMIIPDRFKKLRENMLSFFNKNIRIVALRKDSIVPADKAGETISCKKGKIPVYMDIIDPPYPYLHENPFPVKLTDFAEAIDSIFERVFRQAAVFLG